MISLLDKFLEKDVPVILWGPPGVGKSASICAYEQQGWQIFVLNGAIMQPEDILGLPTITKDGATKFCPPDWAIKANVADRAIVFLSELSTALPAMQAAMLRVAQERSVGSLMLGPNVRVVADANPPTSMGGGFHLSPALANRFAHIDFVPDFVSWSERIMTATHVGNSAAPLVCGFLSARRTMFAPPVPLTQYEAGRAWPSPRSWTNSITALDGESSLDSIVQIAATLIGASAAHEFGTWVISQDLPDSRSVIADPSIVDWTKRPDRLHAILLSVVALVAADPSEANWNSAWAVLGYVAKSASVDVGYLAASSLLALPVSYDVPFAELSMYRTLMQRMRV